MNQTLHVGILVFNGFEVLDIFGPVEALGSACFVGQQVKDPTPRPFELHYLAPSSAPVQAGNGQNVSVLPDAPLQYAPPLDIFLIPGGLGTRTLIDDDSLIDEVQALSARVQIMVSVCTGAAVLARAGVLCGLRATTNHQAYDWVRSVSTPPGGKPILWTRDLRWVDEGHVVTSAGVSAGTDMALYLVQRLFGAEVADATAEKMEYAWEHDPSKQPAFGQEAASAA